MPGNLYRALGQKSENSNATGKLIGHVAPTKKALRKRIRFLS